MSEYRKTALVTGGSRGIGRATAIEFLKHGYNVAIIDIFEDKEKVLNDLKKYGDVNYVVYDLSRTEGIEDCVMEAIKPFGRLDALVNNASKGAHDYLLDISIERWDSYMDLALKSMFFVSQAAAKLMISCDSKGTIVSLSSLRADRADGTHMLYSVAKAGIAAMTRELAFSLGKYGIRVNAVMPGFVRTEMTEHYISETEGFIDTLFSLQALEKVLDAGDMAKLIYFLASDENTSVTAQCIVADAG
ncbi:MAG: SDR family oxidoreductase, partial [Erysipelotrichaceae bacterium]|nr:SDR family oxidoreductase [Erysipelotrichaceae bacterium]